jgi:hypothetical protein
MLSTAKHLPGGDTTLMVISQPLAPVTQPPGEAGKPGKTQQNATIDARYRQISTIYPYLKTDTPPKTLTLPTIL